MKRMTEKDLYRTPMGSLVVMECGCDYPDMRYMERMDVPGFQMVLGDQHVCPDCHFNKWYIEPRLVSLTVFQKALPELFSEDEHYKSHPEEGVSNESHE